MGCVSYSQRFFGDGRLRREAFREATTAARVELETIEREFRDRGWVHAVGASGTITGIDAILRANGWAEDGITRDALRSLREHIIGVGRVSKLSSLPGLSNDRAPVLAGGLAILIGCFKSLKIAKMSVSDGALREGLLYDTIGRNTHEDVRVRTIERMMARFEVDVAQASRVEATALRCLDQVAYAWELHHPDLRWMLSWASRLHEIGLVLSYSGHHQHGAYIVEHSDMPGFSRGQQDALAALIRAHRRRLRVTTLDELRGAGGDDVLRIALLLRLAAALNRSRDPQPLPPFQLSAVGDKLELKLPAGWLEAHPLTHADLLNERAFLDAAGVTFRVG
jgi:exopolyphosphatase/guanosine-5'-triphosphate,3'-diphosphate pyrophosphatase